MTNSPPGSPLGVPPRPMSAMIRPPRSNSRMSMSSKQGGSRASDEDGKTAVKVGTSSRCSCPPLAFRRILPRQSTYYLSMPNERH